MGRMTSHIWNGKENMFQTTNQHSLLHRFGGTGNHDHSLPLNMGFLNRYENIGGSHDSYPIPWSSRQDVFIFGMSQVTLHPCSSHQNSWQMDVHHPKHYIHRLYSYWSIAILVSTVGCWANVATDRGEGSFIGIMPNMWSCRGDRQFKGWGIYHNFPISWNTIVCWLVFLYCWYGLVHKPG